MGQIATLEKSESELKSQLQENDEKINELNDKSIKLQMDKATLQDKVDTFEMQGKNNTRSSIGSDGDEYTSVQDMKDNLKHARQILIQFIQKLPYS